MEQLLLRLSFTNLISLHQPIFLFYINRQGGCRFSHRLIFHQSSLLHRLCRRPIDTLPFHFSYHFCSVHGTFCHLTIYKYLVHPLGYQSKSQHKLYHHAINKFHPHELHFVSTGQCTCYHLATCTGLCLLSKSLHIAPHIKNCHSNIQHRNHAVCHPSISLSIWIRQHANKFHIRLLYHSPNHLSLLKIMIYLHKHHHQHGRTFPYRAGLHSPSILHIWRHRAKFKLHNHVQFCHLS